MASCVLPFPSSATAFTEREFAPCNEFVAPSPAAFNEPKERRFRIRAAAHSYSIIVNTGVVPGWVQPTLIAFSDVQTLSDDWDSYGGTAINKKLIEESLIILTAIMRGNSPPPSVVPLADGGIQIEWHRRQQDLEIVFPAGEPPHFSYRNRATRVEEEGAPRETSRLVQFLQNLV